MTPELWAVTLVVVGLVLVVVIQDLRLAGLRRRHANLAAETIQILRLHQDYLAGLDARLRALGSRTPSDQPIPTADEMAEGRWQR
jgi:hypothetical protein